MTYGDIIQTIFADKTYSSIVAMIGGVSQPNSLVVPLVGTLDGRMGQQLSRPRPTVRKDPSILLATLM